MAWGFAAFRSGALEPALAGLPFALRGLMLDGVYNGLSTVASFVPMIVHVFSVHGNCRGRRLPVPRRIPDGRADGPLRAGWTQLRHGADGIWLQCSGADGYPRDTFARTAPAYDAGDSAFPVLGATAGVCVLHCRIVHRQVRAAGAVLPLRDQHPQCHAHLARVQAPLRQQRPVCPGDAAVPVPDAAPDDPARLARSRAFRPPRHALHHSGRGAGLAADELSARRDCRAVRTPGPGRSGICSIRCSARSASIQN